MKYPTKVDRWLAVVMAISALVTVSVPICIILSPGISTLEAWGTVLFAISIIGFVAAVSLPTCYEVQSDRLIIRSGLLRWSIQSNEAMDGKGFHTTLCYKHLTTENSLGIFRSHW